MQYLKADVAATILIGPAVAYDDGVTPVTDVTLAAADHAELMKHDGTTFVDLTSDSRTFTHKEGGWYTLALGTGDTDTEGRLTVLIMDTDKIVPIWKDFMVVNANVYDSLFAAATTDYLQVDALQIGGTTQSATDLKDFADTGYDPETHKVEGVVLTDGCTANTDMRGTDSAATASALTTHDSKLDTVDTVVDGIQTDLSNATDGLGALKTEIDANETKIDTVDTVVDGIQTDLSNATDGLGALKALIDAVQTQVDTTGVELSATAVDAIWDELLTAAAHGTTNSAALYLRQVWQSIVTRIEQCGDAGSASTIDLDSGASGVTDYYKGQLVVITSGTGKGQARSCTAYNGTSKVATVSPDWATAPDGDSWFAILNTGSTIPVTQALTVAEIADGVWDESTTGHTNSGTFGEQAKTDIDAILTDTAEIGAAGAGLSDLGGMSTTMKGQVNAEVDTALATTTYAEPSGVIAATSSLKDKICWLFTLARNKITQTSTTQTLRNDADDADIATSTVSDDGTTCTRGEFS